MRLSACTYRYPYNIVTLLLAWRDCQNGTLDSIKCASTPTHTCTNTHAQVYVHAHTLRDTHAHTHTNTCAQNKHTHSQSPFNVYPHGDTL